MQNLTPVPLSDRGRGCLVPANDSGKEIKFRIFEQGPGGKSRIIDRGLRGEGGQNKLCFCLFLYTSLCLGFQCS